MMTNKTERYSTLNFKGLARVVIAGLMALATNHIAYANFNGNDRYSVMEEYRQIQSLYFVDGKDSEAEERAVELMKKIEKDDPLHASLEKILDELNGESDQVKEAKARGFVTGVKDEFYCRGKGLVYLKARHNDGENGSPGSITELKMISEDRDVEGYAIVKKGKAVFELSTGYREPIRSTVNFIEASATHFVAREKRRKKNGLTDRGRYSSYWKNGANSTNYSTQGEGEEPAPLYLAMDYAFWGTTNLGFKMKFKVGEKYSIRSHEKTYDHKRIGLINEMETIKAVPRVDYIDAEKKNHSHRDCFLVRSRIKHSPESEEGFLEGKDLPPKIAKKVKATEKNKKAAAKNKLNRKPKKKIKTIKKYRSKKKTDSLEEDLSVFFKQRSLPKSFNLACKTNGQVYKGGVKGSSGRAIKSNLDPYKKLRESRSRHVDKPSSLNG